MTRRIRRLGVTLVVVTGAGVVAGFLPTAAVTVCALAAGLYGLHGVVLVADNLWHLPFVDDPAHRWCRLRAAVTSTYAVLLAGCGAAGVTHARWILVVGVVAGVGWLVGMGMCLPALSRRACLRHKTPTSPPKRYRFVPADQRAAWYRPPGRHLIIGAAGLAALPAPVLAPGIAVAGGLYGLRGITIAALAAWVGRGHRALAHLAGKIRAAEWAGAAILAEGCYLITAAAHHPTAAATAAAITAGTSLTSTRAAFHSTGHTATRSGRT